MIIECRQCSDRQRSDRPGDDRNGAAGECRGADCLIAAFAALERPEQPRQPERPDWILQAPDEFDNRELEALAVLSDAGLVPALLPAMSAPSAIEGDEPDDAFWPVEGGFRDVG